MYERYMAKVRAIEAEMINSASELENPEVHQEREVVGI